MTRRNRSTLAAALSWAPAFAVALAAAVPASAQDRPNTYSVELSAPLQGRPPTAERTEGIGQQDQLKQKVGSVATSSVGVAGRRQEKSQGVANIKPTARLNTRIANRVQSRIRNRIDRFYDPRSNATSPFAVAADEARDNAVTRAR